MLHNRNHDYEKIQASCGSISWVDSQDCDAETLVELSREMSQILSIKTIQIEDMRCFYRLCIDMANDFQKQHADKDWDKEDFLSTIISYATLVKDKLVAFPNWINTDYKWMYGTDTVSDLLSKQ